MEYQQKLLIVTAILAAVALYFVFTAPAPPIKADTSQAQDLLMRSAGFGKGAGDYVYAFSDTSDGYRTSYTLTSSGTARLAGIQNPLSSKKVYLLPNDTILCISYPVNETCSSIYGDPDLENYVKFTESKFFDGQAIDRGLGNLQYLIDKGYLILDPNVTERTVGGRDCLGISYEIDYTNLSLDEAARFSVGSNSPKHFRLSSCVDNATGLPYESTLDYTDSNGISHKQVTTVSSFKAGASQITAPEDLSGDAVSVFQREREQQVKLATCFTDSQGDAREKCVADIALSLRRKDICEISGTRRDRCLVSIVPLTKDQTICGAVNDLSFRDDCFIELAGAYKDASYCSSLGNQSKLSQCQDAATPSNQTNKSGVNIDDFLNYIESQDSNSSNVSNASNSSG